MAFVTPETNRLLSACNYEMQVTLISHTKSNDCNGVDRVRPSLLLAPLSLSTYTCLVKKMESRPQLTFYLRCVCAHQAYRCQQNHKKQGFRGEALVEGQTPMGLWSTYFTHGGVGGARSRMESRAEVKLVSGSLEFVPFGLI